jgi:rifampicin phosphotransferase
MRLLSKVSSPHDIMRFGGRKGLSLYTLGNHGLDVPAWVILGTDVFAELRNSSGLQDIITERLQAFDDAEIPEVAKAVSREILSIPFATSLNDMLEEALVHVGSGPLAIRSSGSEEDGTAFSFAGQFDSYLNVQGLSSITEHVRKCWASCYSERSLVYRRRHGLNLAGVEMAVIVQQMVHATKSGVVFTTNPLNGRRDEMVVSSVRGLGDRLVSGTIDADTIVIERMSGQTRSSVISQDVDPSSTGTDTSPAEPCLTDSELQRLRVTALQVEAIFGYPQDIEWCFDQEALWLLQARRVTTLLPDRSSDFQIWDNSNIIENYPGVTSLLTFTFAQKMYSDVFREFCGKLGIPTKQRREMDEFLGSVLGYFNGRVYYNLLHWYKLSGLAPFQDLGRKMMEIQMGVGERLDLEQFAERINPFSTRSSVEHAYVRIVVCLNFVRLFLSLQRNVNHFRSFFYRTYEKYEAIDFNGMAATEIYAHYRKFRKDLLERWSTMIALESAIGLSYGAVRKLIARWLPDAPQWLEVAIIGDIGSVESVEPAARLDRLADIVRSNAALQRSILGLQPGEAYRAIEASGEAELLHEVDRYIKDFGYRSKNELKLEEPDMRDDPGILFEMLKARLTGRQLNERTIDGEDAERILKDRLKPWQRWLLLPVRNYARRAIKARETVRLCRSKTYGVARRMLRAIGEDLAVLGVLAEPRDIFHMRMDEVAGCFEGTLSHRELKPLLAQRKQDFAAYLQMEELPARFVTHGLAIDWISKFENVQALRTGPADLGQVGQVLRGTPCSPGRAEGEASVIREPNEFEGGILVTYRTDPGWIPIFPAAKAILIERGSPLTHAAIVARELRIPTIVQLHGLTARVKTGMKIRVDGGVGTIELLDADGDCQKSIDSHAAMPGK